MSAVFWDILKFELTYRFRRPVVYLFAALFFALAFSAIATDSVQVGGGIGSEARNSPFGVVSLLSMMSVMGLLALTGFVATAVNRDYEYQTSEFFMSTPAGKGAYLMGRFAGSLIAAMVAVCAAAAGIMLASVMPWQDPQRVLPFSAIPYLYSLGVFVIPNLFFVGALLFAFATLTRRVLFTYIAMIAFLTFWGISQSLTSDLDATFVASVVDPFGKTTLDLATRYWTVVERNTLLPAVSGALALNRALWTALGAGFLALTWARFRMVFPEARTRRERAEIEPELMPRAGSAALPTATLAFGPRARVAQWLHQTQAETVGILRSVPFIVIMAFGVLNLLGSLIPRLEGTTSYPVTYRMLQTIDGSFALFLFICLMVYGALLVWRERRASMHEVQAALPVPDWLPVASKLSALIVVQFAALVVAMLTTMAYQAANGYFHFEIGLYARGLFLMQAPMLYMMAGLALATQVFTNNRLAGFAVMVLYFVVLEVAYTIGLEHNLLMYAETPSAPYSDMNGYGHFVAPVFWFCLYWGLVATVLVMLSVFFWVRGTDVRPGLRWREALRRVTGPRVAVLATALVGSAAAGGWIYYNTNILNEFVTQKMDNRHAVLYEKRYKQYEGLTQPKVTDVKLAVDIFPEKRRVEIEGDLKLLNKADEPIGEIHMMAHERLNIESTSLPPGEFRVEDEELRYSIYVLDEPLAPGSGFDFHYTAHIANPGFENNRSNTRVVENGTFLDTDHVVPLFGYSPSGELADPHERRKHDLPPREDMASPDDPEAVGRTFTRDADWVTYEATLSTSADQIALTAGYLKREWEEEGRRYFHYAMDIPILHFYPFISGRYEIARDRWNDVAIEVYHHRTHTYNVERMIESVKRSLDYYTANFGPYQHRQIRIVEFPRYQRFAQSFAGIIPYSESAHFIEDLRDQENIDMVFYITAHEVAHQWWGHQMCPAWVRGGYFLGESLAQYSALMVMEKDYGPEQMKKFLAYELDRYLRGRGRERDEELPLALCEHQSYIYYNKGSLATYALRDYVGEERMNAALRRFVEEAGYRDSPYPSSTELISLFREATPDEHQYLVGDMFETITLYDNRTEEATFEETEDGQYRVRLSVQSRKMRADGRGVETEVEQNDWIEIGVFGEERVEGKTEETTLYLAKHRLEGGVSEIEVVVDEKPVRAGIDPRNLLVDRVPSDNVRKVVG